MKDPVERIKERLDDIREQSVNQMYDDIQYLVKLVGVLESFALQDDDRAGSLQKEINKIKRTIKKD